MLKPFGILSSLLLPLAIAGGFSKSCRMIQIFEQSTILKARCLSVERAERDSSIDLNTCLRCESQPSACSWDSCKMDPETFEVQCHNPSGEYHFNTGKAPIFCQKLRGALTMMKTNISPIEMAT